MVNGLNSARSQMVGEFNGLGIAIVYLPDGRTMSGPLGFSVQKEGKSDLEYSSIFLSQGLQFVEPARWDAIADSPAHKSQIDRLVRRRILTIIRPTLEEDAVATGTTLDFEDSSDVVFMIENAYNLDWLRASYTQEVKRQDVKKACSERITAVTKMAAERKIPMASFGG